MKSLILILLFSFSSAAFANVTGVINGQPFSAQKAVLRDMGPEFYLLVLSESKDAACQLSFAELQEQAVLVLFPKNIVAEGSRPICPYAANDCVSATLYDYNKGENVNLTADGGSIDYRMGVDSFTGNLTATYSDAPGGSVSGDFTAEICH
jgi:hypothetical protein